MNQDLKPHTPVRYWEVAVVDPGLEQPPPAGCVLAFQADVKSKTMPAAVTEKDENGFDTSALSYVN